LTIEAIVANMEGNEVQSGQQDELGCCPFEAQTREEAERISQGLTC